MTITIYNRSSVVNNDNFTKIVSACSSYLTTFASEWKLENITLTASSYNSSSPILDNTVYILDNTDSPGALGYHYELNGTAISKVFAKTVLDYGGAILYRDSNTFTVAQTITHEILEMVGNGNINKWYLSNSGTFWAGEMCDAVQNNLYVVTLPGNVRVGLSDYILPAWTMPDKRTGPYNKMNTLRAPLTIDRYGYSIIIRNNRVSAVYGLQFNPNKRNKVLEDIEEVKKAYGLSGENDTPPVAPKSSKSMSSFSQSIREFVDKKFKK